MRYLRVSFEVEEQDDKRNALRTSLGLANSETVWRDESRLECRYTEGAL
jgi:hypothetical protein